MDDNLISGISYIKSSKYRTNIILILSENIMTPKDIQGKLNIRINHVSMYLKELRDMGIIVCLNDDAKKGRLYQLSEYGNELIKYL